MTEALFRSWPDRACFLGDNHGKINFKRPVANGKRRR